MTTRRALPSGFILLLTSDVSVNVARGHSPIEISPRQRQQQDTNDRCGHERDESDYEKHLEQLLHHISPPD
jgi:hypothetical protein